MDKIQIEFSQEKISKDHNSSFWYEGDIATLRYKDRTVNISVNGEIIILDRNGNLVFDGKERNDGIFGGFKSDKDLVKIDGVAYILESANWFELTYQLMDNEFHYSLPEEILGDVAFTYDSAIKRAKEYLNDNEFWD